MWQEVAVYAILALVAVVCVVWGVRLYRRRCSNACAGCTLKSLCRR